MKIKFKNYILVPLLGISILVLANGNSNAEDLDIQQGVTKNFLVVNTHKNGVVTLYPCKIRVEGRQNKITGYWHIENSSLVFVQPGEKIFTAQTQKAKCLLYKSERTWEFKTLPQVKKNDVMNKN